MAAESETIMFAWIRRRTAAAVLGGFQDALETLEAAQRQPAEPLALPEQLRLRLAEVEEEGETETPGKKRAR